jgi:hypothetical protein
MVATAEQVLAKLKKRTNINNDNNNNNNNNLTTSIIVSNESNGVKEATSSFSLASPSANALEPLAPPLGGIGTLPPTWYGVKLDLFRNGVDDSGKDSLKLRLSITVEQTKVVQIDAALNSPTRHTYRGSKTQGDPKHWARVRSYEAELKKDKIDFRSSKFSMPGKKGSVADMNCFVYKISGTWVAAIIRDGLVYEFDIDGEGSEAFRKNNGFATAYYGQGKSNAKWVSLKELGI